VTLFSEKYAGYQTIVLYSEKHSGYQPFFSLFSEKYTMVT